MKLYQVYTYIHTYLFIYLFNREQSKKTGCPSSR